MSEQLEKLSVSLREADPADIAGLLEELAAEAVGEDIDDDLDPSEFLDSWEDKDSSEHEATIIARWRDLLPSTKRLIEAGADAAMYAGTTAFMGFIAAGFGTTTFELINSATEDPKMLLIALPVGALACGAGVFTAASAASLPIEVLDARKEKAKEAARNDPELIRQLADEIDRRRDDHVLRHGTPEEVKEHWLEEIAAGYDSDPGTGGAETLMDDIHVLDAITADGD